MDRVTIDPASWERPYRDQYQALRRELEARGFRVRINEPAPIEERGAETVYNLALLLATPEVAIRVAEHLSDHALNILEGVLIGYLIGKVKVGPKRGMPRRAKILGPKGELLREVELPPGDQVDDEAD
jgi:hypothetical protein